MAAEGDPVAETSNKQIDDSLTVPFQPNKMKSRGECDEMLEKAFTILTSSAAAAVSTYDDKCRSFGRSSSNKLRNLPCTRNKVKHAISNITFAADQGHFDVSYPGSAPSPGSQISSPTPLNSFAGSEDVNLSHLMCI